MNQEYFNRPEISASELKAMAKSAWHWEAYRSQEGKAEPTQAMLLGTHVHELVLEPLQNSFVVAPKIDMRTKEGKAEAQAFADANKGKFIVEQKTSDKAHAMADRVLNSEFWAGLMECEFETEIPFYTQELKAGVDLYVKPCERYPNGAIVDLKTTQDLSGFKWDFYKYGYDIQAVHYQSVVHLCTGLKPAVIFVVVSSQEPHAFGWQEMPAGHLENWEDKYFRVLDDVKTARVIGAVPKEELNIF